MKYLILLFVFVSQFLSAQTSLNYDSLGGWFEPSFPKEGKHYTYNEVWGYAKGEMEYAFIGSREGTHVLNVTDPAKINQLTFIPGRNNYATWRDFHDFNGYLYLVSDDNHSSLQILDLHYLPDSAPLIYDSDTLFSRAHNIFIDTIGKKLYACSVKDTAKIASLGKTYDLKIFDLSKSYIPELLVEYNDLLDDIDPFHDIWVRNDTGIGNNGNTGLFIYDFSDPDTVTIISRMLSYTDQGYNHSGYATLDGKHYYFADETHGKDLKAIDISNIKDPTEVHLFNSGRNPEETMPHNLIVHDTMLYVSYYHEGFQAYSLKDPAKPEKFGHYHTYSTKKEDDDTKIDYSGAKGAWGVYPFLPSGNILLSDREKGLLVLTRSTGLQYHEIKAGSEVAFPIPFENEFYLNYDPNQIIKIRIYDLQGKLVEDDVVFEEKIRITRVFPTKIERNGLYIMEVEAIDQKFTLKISKQ